MKLFKKHPLISVVLLALLCMAPFAGLGNAAQAPLVVDGAKVTFLYVITVPGPSAVEVRDIGQFVQGQHQILPSLEREMDGMQVGEEKRVELTPEQGFGVYDDKKKRHVARTELPLGTKEGDVLKDQQGRPAIVSEMSESAAVLDYNHPLAGKLLFVQIKILTVENPS